MLLETKVERWSYARKIEITQNADLNNIYQDQ